MKPTGSILAYWLIPAEPARSELSAVIGELAARFDAPVFEPHLTLYGTGLDGENPAWVLARVKTPASYRLAIRGLDYSDIFTKTLFIQFEPADELSRLSDDLRRAATSPLDYELNPHLSLIYKTMETETKRQLAATLSLGFSEVTFDSLKAVITPETITSRHEVEAWRVVAERRLTE